VTDFLEMVVPEGDHRRLDIFLADELREVSRSKIKSWCKEGLVSVGGAARKGSYLVHQGDEIRIAVPHKRSETEIEPEDIPLDIVFEDDHIVLVNKLPGMVVHPGAGVHSGTLVNALAWHFEHLATRGGVLRPGIVHRLDKGTSGLLLVAKTDAAHAALTRQWQEGTVTKVYQALVWGIPEPAEGEIETHIGRHPKYRHLMTAEALGGRWSKTRYKLVAPFTEASQVNVHILTGRTHQVRVHMAHLGHPVVGDALYGKNRHKNLARTFLQMPDRPMLHAGLLRFIHPSSGEEMTFKQELPADFSVCAGYLAKWPY